MHARRMRGEETGQICEVERVHARRMRGEETGQYVRLRGCMREG